MGKVIRWTTAEDDVIRSFWKVCGTIASYQHLVPGRSVEAIAHRGGKLELGPRVIWTPEEDDMLRRIWAEGGPIKRHAAELPRHSVEAIITRANNLKLGKRPKRNRGSEPISLKLIKKQLQIADMTTLAISRVTGIDKSTVVKYIGSESAAGRLHIVSWRKSSKGGVPAAVYRIGAGVNQPRPARLTLREKPIKAREKKRKESATVRFNPFSTAAGLVAAPTGSVASSFRHVLATRDEEREFA